MTFNMLKKFCNGIVWTERPWETVQTQIRLLIWQTVQTQWSTLFAIPSAPFGEISLKKESEFNHDYIKNILGSENSGPLW